LKEYRFPNQVGATTAWSRIEPELVKLSKEHSLAIEKEGPYSLRLKKKGFADILVAVTDKDVVANVDLSWLVPSFVGKRIEDELNTKVPPLLKA